MGKEFRKNSNTELRGMGARNTTPVKDGQKFTLKTEAKVVSESTVGAGERKKVLAFLETAAFRAHTC